MLKSCNFEKTQRRRQTPNGFFLRADNLDQLNKDLWHEVFHWKPQTANCSQQLRVCIFTLPGFQILARRSLFSAAMLFFVSQSVLLLSPKKTGIIYLFKFKNPTRTSQIEKKSYCVPLNVRLSNHLVAKKPLCEPGRNKLRR